MLGDINERVEMREYSKTKLLFDPIINENRKHPVSKKGFFEISGLNRDLSMNTDGQGMNKKYEHFIVYDEIILVKDIRIKDTKFKKTIIWELNEYIFGSNTYKKRIESSNSENIK